MATCQGRSQGAVAQAGLAPFPMLGYNRMTAPGRADASGGDPEMNRAYNVIDADGHILEPLTLWDDYMDPAFRARAPRLIVDKDGKERLQVEERVLGSKKGLGLIGGVGARDGVVCDDTMSY